MDINGHQLGIVKSPLEQAAQVIANGKQSGLARALGVGRSTVAGWSNPERRAKNLCGRIPVRYFPKLKDLYAAKGLEFDPRQHLPG